MFGVRRCATYCHICGYPGAKKVCCRCGMDFCWDCGYTTFRRELVCDGCIVPDHDFPQNEDEVPPPEDANSDTSSDTEPPLEWNPPPENVIEAD